MTFWSGLFTSPAEIRALRDANRLCSPASPFAGPLVASLLLTYRCNLRCLYCPFPAQARAPGYREGSTEDWLSVIDRLAAAGVRRVSLSGGEPLLYPDVVDLVRRIRFHGLTASLVTNGHLLEEALPALLKAGLGALTVSVDSADPAVYDRIRRGGGISVERILAAVVRARRTHACWVGLNVVLTTGNLDELPALLGLCRLAALPVQVQVSNRLVAGDGSQPDRAQLEPAVELLIRNQHPCGPVTNGAVYLQGMLDFVKTGALPASLGCLVPWVEVVVSPDLRVQPCCVAPAVGHALDEDLAVLWSGEGFAYWRRRAAELRCAGCMLLYHEQPEEVPCPA